MRPLQILVALSFVVSASAAAFADTATDDDIQKGWGLLPPAVQEELRKKIYYPFQYVKVRIDYETVQTKPTEKIIEDKTPMLVVIAVSDGEKPDKPGKIPPWKPAPMRLRGKTSCHR